MTLHKEYKASIEEYNNKLNQFNNSLDDDLTDILIHELNTIEQKIAYIKKKIKSDKVD